MPTAAADLDGDGIDEIICIISEMTARAAADPAAGMFAGLDPEASDEERALWVAEHAGPRGGYFNPASGEVVEFEFPETNYRYNVYLGLPEEICAADIDGDGRPEVLARAAIGSHLLAFDARGALVYHEEFGTAVLGSGVAGCAAGDCVVLQLEDRLLCYP